MRRHEADMRRALQVGRIGELTEEQRQQFKVVLETSFNAAQSEWDAYRDHLIEHGVLTPASQRTSGVTGS
jgi:hypothetical protein